MAKVAPVIRAESREQADAKVIVLEHLEREYNINKIYLSYLGVWPCQSNFAKYFISSCCLLLIICYYPYEILLLYDSWEDSLIRFDVFYLLNVTSLLAGKIFNGIWNHKKMEDICIAMNDHWNIFTRKLEVQTLKNYSNISRKLTIAYSVWIYFAATIFTTTPLVPILLDAIHPLNESRPRLLPIRGKFGILEEKYYAQLYCFNVCSIVLGITNMIANDTTYLVFILHACSLFSTISQQFEEIITQLHVNKDVRKFASSMNTKLQCENKFIIYKYVMCLKKYQLALKFINMLNSTYKIISLTFLILNGAIVTLAGVQIIYVLDRLQDVTKYGFIVTAVLTQLFILCYLGQKLMDESENVFYRAYAAKWYKCSSRLKTLLSVTLYRSIIPCSLTAGDMVPLSMITFGSVVRTAGSYFMTFLSLKE